MYSPERTVYDALERAGYEPHGPEYSFRSRCPAHDGDNQWSLAVGLGADGRVILRCFARECSARNIVAAIGLRMADLFPDHHHRAPSDRRPPRIRRADPTEALLMGLWTNRIGYDLTPSRGFYIAERCPVCASPDLWIWKGGRDVYVSCPNGCAASAIISALTRNARGKTHADLRSLYVTET